MALRIAVKRLSAVETEPGRSNQHEFHAGTLRRELELPDHRHSGSLHVLMLGDSTGPAVVVDSAFTLYDAREARPARSAEWRLYYSTPAITEFARANDLLLLYRHGAGLRAVIARAGSVAEGELLQALELGDAAVRDQFRYMDVPVPSERESRLVVEQLALPEAVPPDPDYPVMDHALFSRAVGEGRLPATAEMAAAAAEIARHRGITAEDPDAWLFEALKAETSLYFAIEADVYQPRYDVLAASNPRLTEIIDFAMSVQQSRRTRRGASLQNHFSSLLDDRNISYAAQCETEDGERPDFVTPSCDAYHDLGFSANGLRMVACKTTAKERWRQVLNEAARIPEKYLLTIDPDMTAAVIAAMKANSLLPFVPRPVIESAYARDPSVVEELGTVAALLQRLSESAGYA